MDPLVRLDVSDGVATLTLDSPGNRNALSRRLRGELRAHLEQVLSDDAVRVVVLTHTGPVFCSGMDLREARGADAAEQGVGELPDLLVLLQTAEKPVVAKLYGAARAGGLALVAAADVAVAADTVTVAVGEVRLGLVPAVLAVAALPRLEPRAAQRLFLTGEVVDAAAAARLGLLTAAVPREEVDAEVRRCIDAFRAAGPRALAATKGLLLPCSPDVLRQRYADAAALSAAQFASPEGQEGLAAFAQKRRPGWAGATGS